VRKRGSREFIDSFGAVTRSLRALAEEAYAAFEVGTAQAKLLRHIGSAGRISQADLARATQTAPTLTGRALETLVKRAWVRRKRSEEDRREYELELTPAGHRIRERVEEARDGIVDRVATVLDEKDYEDFDRIAKKILTAFAEFDQSPQRPDPGAGPGR
jgi:DNA-binding MarR family transcriptional regulator